MGQAGWGHLRALGVLLLGVAGCSQQQGAFFWDQMVQIASPYSAPVRQGNWVDEAMLQALQPGMTAEEVQRVLGTPLLVDPFRTDRWDYLYRYDDRQGQVQRRRVTLWFREGRLHRVEVESDGEMRASSKE